MGEKKDRQRKKLSIIVDAIFDNEDVIEEVFMLYLKLIVFNGIGTFLCVITLILKKVLL